MIARLKKWLLERRRVRAMRTFTEFGLVLQVEARHGAFRTRHKQLWKGELVRVDIPLQKKHGVIDSPMGRISSEEGQKLIDAFTGLEGEDPFQRTYQEKIEGGVTAVCPFCGQERKRAHEL